MSNPNVSVENFQGPSAGTYANVNANGAVGQGAASPTIFTAGVNTNVQSITGTPPFGSSFVLQTTNTTQSAGNFTNMGSGVWRCDVSGWYNVVVGFDEEFNGANDGLTYGVSLRNADDETAAGHIFGTFQLSTSGPMELSACKNIYIAAGTRLLVALYSLTISFTILVEESWFQATYLRV